MSLLHRVFAHYFLLILPFAAISAAFGLMRILHLSPTLLWKRCQRAYPPLAALAIGILLSRNLLVTVVPYGLLKYRTTFNGAYDIALYTESSLQQDETLYGDFGIAPTVALLSGRRIAANEIDSSIMRFEAGFSSLDAVLAAIEEDNVSAVLLRPGRGIGLYPPFKEYVEEHYTLERRFMGADSGWDVEFWRRNPETSTLPET